MKTLIKKARTALADFWRDITVTATGIRRNQDDLAALDASINKARMEVNQAGYEAYLSEAQHHPLAQRAALNSRYAEKKAQFDQLRERRRRLDSELYEQHSNLNALHANRHRREVLGDRAIELPALRDWRNDAVLQNLRGHLARVQRQIGEAGETVTRLEHSIAETDRQAKALRIKKHKGQASHKEIDAVALELARLQGEYDAARRDGLELRDAEVGLVAEIDAREATLKAQEIPALLEQYKPLVAAFLDTLIDAAAAQERMRPVVGALINAGLDSSRLIGPWMELDINSRVSRLNVVLELARERGFVTAEQESAA